MEIQLRPATSKDQDEVAKLIRDSTNQWYQSNGKAAIFQGSPTSTLLFSEVYEDIDPGCCLLAIDTCSKNIAGSCFYHPRETHFSLGIMNVHPDYFGGGIARKLLQAILDLATKENKPTRLVSSAMNLDSFSLYSRAGFAPYAAFQDMLLEVPTAGTPVNLPTGKTLRTATTTDISAMVALEEELLGIRRGQDFSHIITNQKGYWHTTLLMDAAGELEGFLSSIHHPASALLGPGCMREATGALALIQSELNIRKGKTMVFLVPCQENWLVQQLYETGAKNCEIHFAQSTRSTDLKGIMIPTFMPETA